LAGIFEPGAIDAVVEVLAGLAGGGRTLELGIGTGRIAVSLERRGVTVHGIDLSRAMVSRLRAKPEGAAIGVTIGDFAIWREGGVGLSTPVPGRKWAALRAIVVIQ
jgi:16S rRNA A1518/A1519 N6-dimethyltransferase RsmA/KsgA/DIM1 with predicted DNA glycosylase/AP lyase activity